MPIESEHPEYTAMKPTWNKCRTCYQGEDAVKKAGETYLPKLSEAQSEDDYKAFKKRARFFEFTERTVSGLVGSALTRKPTLKFPDRLKGLVAKEDMKAALNELVITGGFGLLVDMPRVDNEQPYISIYRSEQIVNWWEDSDSILQWLVLKESYWESDESDPYLQRPTERLRELRLEDGKYVQIVHVKKHGATDYTKQETIVPEKNTKNLAQIPFWRCGPRNLEMTPDKPPILGVANANLSHYCMDADHRHALHHGAIIQPYMSGFTTDEMDYMAEKGITYKVGGGTAWVVPGQGQVGMLETSGSALNAQAKEKEAIQELIAVLGGRIIEGQRAGVEAAETARIRQAGEISALSSMVLFTSQAFEKAAKFAAAWANQNEDDVNVAMSQEFLPLSITDVQARLIMDMQLNGRLSVETMFELLKEGKLFPEGFDIEAEVERLDKESLNRNKEGKLDLEG